MGVCEGLFSKEPSPNNKRNNDQINQRITQYPPRIKPNGNLFCSPIGDSNNMNNLKNMNMSQSQSQLTLINYPKKKAELPVYKNVYKQNGNLQTSLATGSLYGDNNNISSIMSGNKGESKYSENNMSTSKSFGEFIIDNQINKNMEGDQDFNNFMKMNKDYIINDTNLNINDSNNNNINNSEQKNNKNNNNKKDVNYYHKKNSKNINHPPIPMDTEV